MQRFTPVPQSPSSLLIPISLVMLSSLLGIGAVYFFAVSDTILPLLLIAGFLAIIVAIWRLDFLIFLTTLVLILFSSQVVGLYSSLRDPLEYGRWVLFTIFILIALGEASLSKRLRKLYFFDLWVLMWLAFAFFSTSYSILPSLTFQRTLSLLLVYLAIFWSIWIYADRQGEDRVVEALLFTALLVHLASWFFFPWARSSGRFAGLLANPNGLAHFTAFLFPLALERALNRRKPRDLLLIGLMLTNLIQTGTRGALIATGVSSSYMLWKVRSGKFWVPLLPFILIGLHLLLGGGVLPEHWENSPYLRVEDILESGGGRYDLWTAAKEIISLRPIWGYGFGTEEHLFTYTKIFPETRQGVAYHFHNAYLGLAGQVGILGALVFYLPLFYLLLQSVRRRWYDLRLSPVHAYQGTLIAGLIGCFSESWIYSMGNPVAFPWWVITMLLVRRFVSEEAAKRGGSSRDPSSHNLSGIPVSGGYIR